MRARWGLAGLLGFEAILVAYTAANGISQYTLMALAAMAALAWAIVGATRTGRVPRIALALLAVITLARGLAQTTGPGPLVTGLLPTFLVPLGFALLLVPRIPATLGVAAIAAARTWFVWWYFEGGATMLVVANVVGAAGAWAWWAAVTLADPPAEGDDAPSRA